ncbi:hypothetical protein TNCV_4637401 [Trichonephila clavipes]|nr:hypothetical protein TNCV_4637401 [Trichonephila clavipes]
MDEILTTARDLELEVNEDDIEELMMGHEDELTTEELQEILNEEHQETQRNSERGPRNSSWQEARSTPVVGLGHHTGDSTRRKSPKGRDGWRHHLSPPPQFRHENEGHGQVTRTTHELPPALQLSYHENVKAVTPECLGAPPVDRNLLNAHPCCTRWISRSITTHTHDLTNAANEFMTMTPRLPWPPYKP